MPTGGREPDDGCCCKSPNKVFPDEDDAAANEPYSGNDLRCDSGRIEDDAVILEYVGKTVFGDKHDQRGGNADQRTGAQADALLTYLALKPDQRGQYEGQRKFGQLEPALSDWFSEQHVIEHLSPRPYRTLRRAMQQRLSLFVFLQMLHELG
jgi:hypothetical protein